MFAHYTAISKFKTVTITRTPSLQYGDNRVAEIVVSGKAEARKPPSTARAAGISEAAAMRDLAAIAEGLIEFICLGAS
jgi:hypothetical protein